MARLIQCDRCRLCTVDAVAEEEWFKLTQGTEDELWFCSVVCLNGWSGDPQVEDKDSDEDPSLADA